jgi:hypothetical protein
MNPDIDINQQFRKFLDIVFPHYRGVHLEVVEGGYKLFGEFYPSLDAVDEKINQIHSTFGESINRIKSSKNSK